MSPTATPTIAVGFDGSDASEAAVDWASLEAVRRGADLRIVTAVDYPGAWTGLLPGDPTTPQSLLHGAQLMVEAAQVRASKVLSEDRIATVVLEGSVTASLMTALRGCTLLVVGNKRRSTGASLATGSTTYALAAHAPVPVAAVPEPHIPEPGDGAGVVVGVDGSAPSTRALVLAADEAVISRRGLTVLAVWTTPVMSQSATGAYRTLTSQDLEDALEEAATAAATDAAAIARTLHPGLVVTTLVRADQPAAALARAGAGASLVVVGSRGRGGFTSLILGSVSHTVLHHCTVPVMVAR